MTQGKSKDVKIRALHLIFETEKKEIYAKIKSRYFAERFKSKTRGYTKTPGHTCGLKGLCQEMNNFFEGLKNQISTFCICDDSF
jgi:hypothetical protein